MKQDEWEFFARCASGFEQVLAQELKQLDMRRVRPLHGGVAFFGDKTSGYRACLWSRVATRVQLVLARVEAADANALYKSASGFAWEDHVAPLATIALKAHGTNNNLRNTTFTALKVKDALCDRLRKTRGIRPDVDARNPDFSVDIALHEKKATLYLNLSGESLHRRGYREDGTQTEAPIKETLAAGILLMADWPALAEQGGYFIDPMCGSGTFAIEAALIASNTAPGLLRERWGFEGWCQHDAHLFAAARDEAYARVEESFGKPRILASDIDEASIEIARDNAQRAGVQHMIQFAVADAARLGRRLHAVRRVSTPGLLATNPPYGMRLLSQSSLPQTYAALATAVDELPHNWHVAVITPDPGIDSALGRVAQRTLPCYNGPIETWVRLYSTSSAKSVVDVTSLTGEHRKVAIAEKTSDQFAARFRKVARERMRWARSQGIACYRIYDSDLPDYAFSVDLYQGNGASLGTDPRQGIDSGKHADPKQGANPSQGVDPDERYALLREQRRSGAVDVERAARRLADARSIVSAVLSIPAAHVLVHEWQQKQGRPVDKTVDDNLGAIEVQEGSVRFAIDLNAPQVSLPLWQRSIRQLAKERGQGKRVACLFATGRTALAMAATGAASTVTVDASKEHVEGVRRILAANHLGTRHARFVVMDPHTWVAQEQRRRHTFDLVLCIPPTWLPAKDAGGREWDLQRDGADLLRSATHLLAKDGVLLFACEDKVPNMDGLAVDDISDRVLPHDFERTRTKPRCWIVRRSR